MRIRTADLKDINDLKILYVNTILAVNSRDYNSEQISAWASTSENIDSLKKRITGQYFIVAENDEGIITGFASLDTKSGYLDLLYVHKDFQRTGVATLMLHNLLRMADEMNISEINTDASITIRPFFKKNGFRVLNEQTVNIKGVEMRNFRMQKNILY